MINKLFVGLNSLRIRHKNGKSKVAIFDFGRTVLQINKGSISGNGTLYFNKNAVSCFEKTKIRIDQGGKLIIHGTVSFFPGCNIHILKDATLEVSDSTFFNEGTKVSIKKYCKIGTKCAISNDVTIIDSDFHFILGAEKEETGIILEDHCWIGVNTTILKNVVLGRGSIIGANSVISKSIPEYSLVVGNPGRIIRRDVSWE